MRVMGNLVNRLFVLLGLSVSYVAVAGEYKVVNDTYAIQQSDGTFKVERHAEVCSAFLQSLKSWPSYLPVACDMKFKPQFKDFKVPDWQDIDVWENRELDLQIGNPPKNPAEEEKQLKEIMEAIKMGRLAYRTTRFDMDNDGVAEQILMRIDGKTCIPNVVGYHENWRGYYVYNPSTRKLNPKKVRDYRYWLGGGNSMISYKGTTYYVSIGETYTSTKEPFRGMGKAYIRLYLPLPASATPYDRAVEACQYVYIPSKREKH